MLGVAWHNSGVQLAPEHHIAQAIRLSYHVRACFKICVIPLAITCAALAVQCSCMTQEYRQGSVYMCDRPREHTRCHQELRGPYPLACQTSHSTTGSPHKSRDHSRREHIYDLDGRWQQQPHLEMASMAGLPFPYMHLNSVILLHRS